MNPILRTDPAVFLVGDTYQIMAPVSRETLFWVKVGEECFYDDSNGILRSAVTMHRVTVPAELLNREKRYTVFCRPIIERKPYFPTTEPLEEFTYEFRPVPEGRACGFQIADAHNLIEAPIKAAEAFIKQYGAIDFLILNGDVADHSGRIENFDNFYILCSRLTHGSLPVIFSRGNHDMRGVHAEELAEYTPTDNGRSYFTFRMGDIWGVVLDSGEDKVDDQVEYGFTICCHDFRLRESRFLEAIAKERPFDAPGVKHIIAMAHNPFTGKIGGIFDIEDAIFADWGRILREEIKPEIMLCGHMHQLAMWMPGDDTDRVGHPCPIAVGSLPRHGKDGNPDWFAGMGVIFDEDVKIIFIDSEGKVHGEHTV